MKTRTLDPYTIAIVRRAISEEARAYLRHREEENVTPLWVSHCSGRIYALNCVRWNINRRLRAERLPRPRVRGGSGTPKKKGK